MASPPVPHKMPCQAVNQSKSTFLSFEAGRQLTEKLADKLLLLVFERLPSQNSLRTAFWYVAVSLGPNIAHINPKVSNPAHIVRDRSVVEKVQNGRPGKCFRKRSSPCNCYLKLLRWMALGKPDLQRATARCGGDSQ